MKAKIEFDFDLPEDKKQLESIIKADDVVLVIQDILTTLRSYIKYGQYDKKNIKNADDAFEHIQQRIYDLLQERYIDIEF